MKSILITGGFGFVGGRLAASLAAGGRYLVRATSRRPRPAADGIAPVQVAWPECDMDALCAGVHTIVHTAAMAERPCAADPEAALAVNTLATHRLVEAARRAGVERIVYLSTAKVHGNNPAGIIDEGTAPRPQSHYALTHRAAEDYVLASHDRGDVQGVVLRLSNAVGAPAAADADCWSLIVNALCRQAVAEGRVVLSSSGVAWRNFVALTDVVDAIRHVIDLSAAALGDGLFNLGGAQPMTILDAARLVRERAASVLGAEIGLQHGEPAPGETPPSLDFRSQRLTATGFHVGTRLEREIDATLRFCAEQFGVGPWRA